MATVLVPTLAAKVDHNPKGSATTQVTMRANNPFESKVVATRSANQPLLNSALPGMGLAGLGENAGGTTGESNTGSSFWSGLKSFGSQLTQAVAMPAITQLAQKEVDHHLDLNKPAQRLPAPSPGNLSAPSASALPGQTAPQPITITVPSMPPQPAPKGPGALPWVIGGAAVLGIGAILLIAKKKKNS